MRYFIVILAAYLMGSSNMAYFISKAKGVDVRSNGSGNLGASNATVLMGWYIGVFVALHDIGKAALAVILARYFFPDLLHIGAIAGISCVLGHIFPFYLGFKGGKGFASYFGMTMALNWKLGLTICLLAVILTVLTDYIVVGTITTVTVVPVALGIMTQSLLLAAILCIGTVVMYCKHIENFRRMANGTEIGLRSTAKGEHRIK